LWKVIRVVCVVVVAGIVDSIFRLTIKPLMWDRIKSTI
jgi:hypothetical protein